MLVPWCPQLRGLFDPGILFSIILIDFCQVVSISTIATDKEKGVIVLHSCCISNRLRKRVGWKSLKLYKVSEPKWLWFYYPLARCLCQHCRCGHCLQSRDNYILHLQPLQDLALSSQVHRSDPISLPAWVTCWQNKNVRNAKIFTTSMNTCSKIQLQQKTSVCQMLLDIHQC